MARRGVASRYERILDPKVLEVIRRGLRRMNPGMLLIWRLGLGWSADLWPRGFGRLMVIEHVGRRSGARYRTPVNFTRDAGHVYCVAGFGPHTDWYRNVLVERVSGNVKTKDLPEVFNDIRSFERQLADDGYILIKFFLHISSEVQRKRFDKLRKNPATAWRVTEDDLKKHEQYKEYLAVTEEMLAETDSDFAPWTVIEAHDRRFAFIKMYNTVIPALERCILRMNNQIESESKAGGRAEKEVSPDSHPSILDGVDLSLHYEREEYRSKLKRMQKRVRELEHEIYVRRIPVIIVYQGWDAAGKGGNIKRFTHNLDPRGYEVIPIEAPNDIEMAHHYMWRFWTRIPKAGHIGIFDRSWYGRVLVERVEGFCSESEWKRAYREINEFEKHLTNFGMVLLKFWLHIDKDEQLARFKARQEIEHKRWKITEDDWRNREQWDLYKAAVEEMLFRTSTPYAPWTIVESNCKWYARVKVLKTVIDKIEAQIG